MRSVVWWAGAGVGGFVADGITYAVSGGAWAHSHYATWQVSPQPESQTKSMLIPSSLYFWCLAPSRLLGASSSSLRCLRRPCRRGS